MSAAVDRVFLFLQGPHGPFFRRLAAALSAEGAAVRRIAFTPSDVAGWGRSGPVVRFTAPMAAYPAWLAGDTARNGVTAIVLYGDARAHHSVAIQEARRAGIVKHCFEEGYLRPRWITYERGGQERHEIAAPGPEDFRFDVVAVAPAFARATRDRRARWLRARVWRGARGAHRPDRARRCAHRHGMGEYRRGAAEPGRGRGHDPAADQGGRRGPCFRALCRAGARRGARHRGAAPGDPGRARREKPWSRRSMSSRSRGAGAWSTSGAG